VNGAAARLSLFIEHGLTVLALVVGVTLVENWNKAKSFHRAIVDNMKKLFAIILLCLFISIETQAASFDCAQAVSKPEKIICANEELSGLDTWLGEVYRVITSKALPDKAKRLVTEQRQWLRGIRNRCADDDCLFKAYRARLDKLDPFADDNLTCEKMKQFPEIIFSRKIVPYLRYETWPPDQVDYTCSESLSEQKFMQRLIELGEQIRGPEMLAGPVAAAWWKVYHFGLIEAGLSPTMLLQTHTPLSTPIDWGSPKNAGEIIRYFKQWSEQSLSNQILYLQFTSEFDRILPILTKHYQDNFGMPQQDAQRAARTALMLVVERAAGSFSRRELKEDRPLVQAVRETQLKYENIQREVSRASKDDIYDALTVALINNQPLQIVSALAEALSPEALQRIDKEGEPLLSFAIGSQPNLEYLLSQKVPVDEANAFGKTALFYAVGVGNHKAVEALLKAGADVNHAYKSEKKLNPNGSEREYPNLRHTRRTPLMHAAQHSDVQMIDTLLKAGARLDAMDDLFYNALDYAVMGANKDNEAYLKSLGLEFGSPKYSSMPDPAVREQTIQESIPIDGVVEKMLIAPGRPDILAVLAGPKSSLDWYLYLISIADPDHPKVISSFPATYASGDFALSPDGNRAYVFAGAKTERDSPAAEKTLGVNIVDISYPEKPTFLRQIKGDFWAMRLSPDGKYLYLRERQRAESSLLVYNVGSEPARMECGNSLGKDRIDSFVLFPDEPLLLLRSYDQLILFDIKNPCSPVQLVEIDSPENMSSEMLGISGRTIIAPGYGGYGFEKFRIGDSPELERIAKYEGPVDQYYVNAAGDVTAVISDSTQEVAVFRVTKTGCFRLTDRFQLPGKNWQNALQTDTGHVFIGWEGGLGVGRIPKE